MNLEMLVYTIKEKQRSVDGNVALVLPSRIGEDDLLMALAKHRIYLVGARDNYYSSPDMDCFRLGGAHLREIYSYNVPLDSKSLQYLRTRLFRDKDVYHYAIHIYFGRD